MRTGLVAKKLGMSALFTAEGERIPVTLLQIENCQVVEVKTQEQFGYCAVKIAYGTPKNVDKLNKPVRSFFAKNKLDAKKHMVEFRVRPDALLSVGDVVNANHFVPGQRIDVRGVSIGKGFAGAMKRHNFRGLEATHGVSVSHRSHGSTGQCQDPGKVFKNKKMAGRMGGVNKTIQNLQVVRVDIEQNLVIVKGAVPGHRGGYVKITDAIKHSLHASAPFPASIVRDVQENKEASNEG